MLIFIENRLYYTWEWNLSDRCKTYNEETIMLIQFNFKNFKSFRDEVSLELTATKITEHEDHVAEAANDKLLKVAAIYGANASGKSNVYDAFEYMTYYVDESFKFGDEEERRRKTGFWNCQVFE